MSRENRAQRAKEIALVALAVCALLVGANLFLGFEIFKPYDRLVFSLVAGVGVFFLAYLTNKLS